MLLVARSSSARRNKRRRAVYDRAVRTKATNAKAARRSDVVGYALYAFAGAAVLAGAVVTVCAYILSGGSHQFPEGVGQQAAWWTSSLGGLAAATLALRFANRHIERGGYAVRVGLLLALAFVAYATWGLWLTELYRR
jgi:hypothetical protein